MYAYVTKRLPLDLAVCDLDLLPDLDDDPALVEKTAADVAEEFGGQREVTQAERVEMARNVLQDFKRES